MTEALQEEPKINGVSSEPPPADSATSQGQATRDDTVHSPKPRRPSVDKDAQDMVIDSLRTQIQDLISQVSQLNSKLVKSYDRVSDLEDDLHVASANLRSSSVKISQLELERTQHLSALNTGLLVEKTHVTAELNRLMEKATEEAAQRGQAESARMAIEKDLDDLSASLFGQANTMVAEARFQQYQSDRKREESEIALKGAEEAVQLMQAQMQNMQTEKEESEKKMQEMQIAMGKGKWVNRGNGPEQQITLKFLNSHAPFQEFIAFVGHLRVLHSTSPSPPAMSTLLPLPFLARLLTEDSEPTIRLDLAPSLNWLSRRSVLAAIHSGQLTIEPVSAHTLIHEFANHPSSTTVAGLSTSGDNMCCALCGSPVLSVVDHSHPSRPPLHPSQVSNTSWSTSFFKRNSSGSQFNSQPPSPTRQNSTSNYIPNTQIYIFRTASQPTTTIASLPIPSLSKSSSPAPSSLATHSASSSAYNAPIHSQAASPSNQTVTIYPLCQNGWCLTRLRTTCTLWAFVRTNIVDKVWDEELPPPPPPAIPVQAPVPEKPPIPPRKRGLWGIASAIGERAASWGDSDKDKSKRTSTSTTPAPPTEPRRLPPPLPPTPTSAQSPPPPLPSKTTAPALAASSAPPAVTPAPTPPPLPKRAEGRSRTSPPAQQSPRTSLDQPRDAPKPATPTPPTAAVSEAAPASSEQPVIPTSPLRKAHFPTTGPERAHTPSNVPLPESRPATPSGIGRTSSPATVAAGVGAGPAPPPLPRRAAARSRGGAPVPSRTATPANGDTAPVAEKVEEVKKEGEEKEEAKGDVKEVETKTEGGKKSDEQVNANGEAQKKTDEENKVVDDSSEVKPDVPKEEQDKDAVPPSISDVTTSRSTQASPASDEFVDAESVVAPSPAPSDVPQAVVEEKKSGEESQAHEEVAGSTAADKRMSTAESNNETVVEAPTTEESEKDKASPEPVSNGVAVEVVSPSPEGAAERAETKDVKAAVQDEKSAKEEAGYLSDATWEERTWKELVRLREDMFFARVGVVRE
ncbi:hypothetical protein CVT24_013007 [Panaeolus cyanescens]|uniref:GDP/GTP exchange factor Sec2 N-terminal domain-containing protein n=1 Tax=Panaeolus cyanescens TaxID=181874 RepID=A0A409VVM2_9AGAR|nr:hypothetical protein CVT24_013007 [Panaeolus cyanescens]